MAYQPTDKEGSPRKVLKGKIVILLVRTDQLDAVGIGEGLLPDIGRIVTDQCRKPPGEGFIRVVIAVQGFGRRLECAISLSGVGPTEGYPGALFLRANHTATDQGTLGREKVPMGPAALDAEALTGAESCTSRQSSRWASFLLD